MPTPGPVAYHVHVGFFTAAVMSRGFDHVTPSSALDVTHADRLARADAVVMSFSLSSPRLWVISSQVVPVDWSTTGQGLPQVFLPSEKTTDALANVRPPSVERLRIRWISPESALDCRPSQKARSVPFFVTIAD